MPNAAMLNFTSSGKFDLTSKIKIFSVELSLGVKFATDEKHVPQGWFCHQWSGISPASAHISHALGHEYKSSQLHLHPEIVYIGNQAPGSWNSRDRIT